MRRGHFARSLGRLSIAAAVIVVLTVLALELAPGILSTIGVIVSTVLVVLMALAAVSLALPPALLQLDEHGFRAFKKQVAGPNRGEWAGITNVTSQHGEDGMVMFFQHANGRHTAVPLWMLDAAGDEVEAEVRRRLDAAHGYRRLT
ncbi:MAG: hypothetical protein GEU96_16765 [Propionibacteriales bacterium]|nr:hypothetical protein [Propionibacteriales bacterium]